MFSTRIFPLPRGHVADTTLDDDNRMRKDGTLDVRRLFVNVRHRPPESVVVETLLRFGSGALAYARRGGVRVALLHDGEPYRSASSALTRLGIDVDAWPAPPAGLFVVEERTVYLRSRSPMTVAHEFAHALDCALGGGIYRSGVDPRIRSLYTAAQTFITPYAATGVDEYFAESIRAYVGVNDPASPWPLATRERLLRIDPKMFRYIHEVFTTDFEAELQSA
ncbi:MAG: hypothetical protein JO302_01840 [Candidatus Eremiobacteraeota bacterium]|nr:hypothetical protein [Candidatus Eremiobacteraeota bacterium]